MRFIALILIFGITTAVASSNVEEQRKIFGNAEQALKKNNLVSYEKLSSQIKDYPLYPYLIFNDLKRQINKTKSSDTILKKVAQFEASYPDFPKVNQLRAAWLEKAAQAKLWPQYVKAYEGKQNETLQCYYHYGKYQVTQDIDRLKKAKSLWLTGDSLPKSCDLLFKEWQKHKLLTQDLIWQRFQLALNKKNETLIHHLTKQLPTKERGIAKTWDKLNQKPILLTSKKHFLELNIPKVYKKKIIVHLLPKLARQDAEMARKWWQTHAEKFDFTPAENQNLKKAISISLAQQKHPEATTWLQDEDWKIRLGIWDKDWQHVFNTIDQLPPEKKQETIWQYWRARSLEALGENASARILYEKLGKERNYYGFLASLRLEKPVSFAHEPIIIDSTVLTKMAKMPNIQRFYELIALKRVSEARLEWIRATEKMTETERLSAAKIAEKMGLHELAVRTLLNSQSKNDVFLRYPLAHKEEVIKHSKKQGVDPAWVFAIARQESAFHTHAVSPAGARGLMQLMPSTAEILAKRHGIHYPSETSLHIPDVNIQFGSTYLKSLSERMKNHYVLATVSYNAGPLKIAQWLPKNQVMAADIWIENIPYHETREYVKNVMMMTGIYRYQLGKAHDLKSFMRPIPQKS